MLVLGESRGEMYLDPAGETGIAGGEGGLAALVGRLIAAGAAYTNRVGPRGYPVLLPPPALEWIFDEQILPQALAGSAPGEAVEMSTVNSADVAREIAGARKRIWHCRVPAAGWIILDREDAGERPPQELVRCLQRQRLALSALGIASEQMKARPVPDSAVTPGVQLVRLATGGRVIYWARDTFSRVIGEAGPEHAAAGLLDGMLRRDGLSGVVSAMPRTGAEKRGRYAVRALREMIRQGGVAARVLVETAYRSGALYTAMARIVPGLSPVEQKTLRSALGRRRWEQLYDHGQSARGLPPRELPWDSFVQGCEEVMADLAGRTVRAGMAPPEAAARIVRQFYSDPRGARLRQVWQKQIQSQQLVKALTDARLSTLRAMLRTVPREVLLQAGCGEHRDAKMRLSSGVSRQGRRIYLEDVEALQGRIERGEFHQWDTLLSARMIVLAAALQCR